MNWNLKNNRKPKIYLNTRKKIWNGSWNIIREPTIPKILSEYPEYIFKILKFYLKPESLTENLLKKNIRNTENISKRPKYA